MLTTDDIPSIRARWLAEKRPGPRTLTGEEFGLVIDAVVAGLTEVERLRARVAELEAGQDEAKGFIEGLDVENNALRARVAELESMNKMLCGKLDDQRRALWDPCQPYLKDGETPAECIARNRRDVDIALSSVDIALSSLARDRARVAELEAALGKAVNAMRAPIDDWKGEVERAALDDARAVLSAGTCANNSFNRRSDDDDASKDEGGGRDGRSGL